MLSTHLVKHLDVMDAIEEQAQEEIDALIAAIDVREMMQDPQSGMKEVSDEINRIMVEKYIPMAVKEGKELATLLAKLEAQGKEIKIDESKDPTKNKDLLT